MNLYRIYRTDKVGYDEYDSAVVAAESEQDAKDQHPDGSSYWKNECWRSLRVDGTEIDWGDSSWTHPNQISVELLGTAKEGTERGVIVASFNAG